MIYLMRRTFGYLRLTPFIVRALSLQRKYQRYTMIPSDQFVGNLLLARAAPEGCVIECGVWRGGMIAALSEILGDRHYYLFDSFDGLPPVTDRDGVKAKEFQTKKDSPYYHNNCFASIEEAQAAVAKSPARNVTFKKGWFSETLKDFTPEPIAVLRLDADWYDSTMQCLESLYPHVVKAGLIIIDDYLAWNGCCKAVHDYLSKNELPERIREGTGGVFYIIKGA